MAIAESLSMNQHRRHSMPLLQRSMIGVPLLADVFDPGLPSRTTWSDYLKDKACQLKDKACQQVSSCIGDGQSDGIVVHPMYKPDLTKQMQRPPDQ
jgi:hypothetical protein